MPDFGIFRGFNEKLFGDKLYAGQLPTQLGLIGSEEVSDFLLDTYSGAAAAYSLRRLSGSYTGSAIRVRRASDNTEQDIGFVNNELDTSTLTTFCSGTNGFVKTWYDQSGNGNDAEQTTLASQPQIVSSGSVILENGKPAVNFDGTDDGLFNSNFTSTSINDVTMINIGKAKNTSFNVFFSYQDNPVPQVGNSTSSDPNGTFLRQFARDSSGNSAFTTNYGNTLIQHLNFSYLNSNNLVTVYNSSNTDTVSATNVGSINSSVISISSRTASSSTINYYATYIQEAILYPSDQSSNRTGIESNINDFYSIY